MIQLFKQLSISSAYYGALLFFGVAGIMGFILRLAFSLDLPTWINYSHLKHAHSHIALLGWLFAAFILVVIHLYDLDWPYFKSLFLGLQGSVLAMAITFPISGYSALSTIFLGIHILITYALVYRLWKVTSSSRKYLSTRFLYTSLLFLIVASSATWSLPIMVASGLKGTGWYHGAIQFYLHFMFNGWFVFALFSGILKFLENRYLKMDKRMGSLFYWFLIISTILCFAVTISRYSNITGLILINTIGVLVQSAALITLLIILKNVREFIKDTLKRSTKWLLIGSLGAFFIKVFIQDLLIFPSLFQASIIIPNFMVGFVHLLLLACLTFYLFAYAIEAMNIVLDKRGLIMLIVGIVVSEMCLFLQGLWLWMGWGLWSWYHHTMAISSFAMAIGIWILIIKYKSINYENIEHK